jgi:hypothetical protein
MSEEPQEQPDSLARKPQREVATVIAERLGETYLGPRQQIYLIIRALGRTQTVVLFEQTLQIEAAGGMMLPDGSRRRTPGGVFFHLAFITGIPKPGRVLKRPVSRPGGGQKTLASPTSSPFTWQDRLAVIKEIGEQKGSVNTVKITVIGTLGKYVDKGTCVVGTMQHTGEKLPGLPKGVPAPQPVKTNYVVYIGAKQWKKVAETVRDPEDALIIEGFPQIDTKTGAISVFASSVTSKKIQATTRQAQQQESK